MMFKPTLSQLTLADFPIILKIARFYEYELSRYAQEIWPIVTDKQYAQSEFAHYIKSYFQANRYAFLICCEQHPVGFVLLNKVGTQADVQWNMGEFFVLAAYQRHKIGQKVAVEIFKQFLGKWEVAVLPENKRAWRFWHKVISDYTQGNFLETEKLVTFPDPHLMIIFSFESV